GPGPVDSVRSPRVDPDVRTEAVTRPTLGPGRGTPGPGVPRSRAGRSVAPRGRAALMAAPRRRRAPRAPLGVDGPRERPRGTDGAEALVGRRRRAPDSPAPRARQRAVRLSERLGLDMPVREDRRRPIPVPDPRGAD